MWQLGRSPVQQTRLRRFWILVVGSGRVFLFLRARACVRACARAQVRVCVRACAPREKSARARARAPREKRALVRARMRQGGYRSHGKSVRVCMRACGSARVHACASARARARVRLCVCVCVRMFSYYQGIILLALLQEVIARGMVEAGGEATAGSALSKIGRAVQNDLHFA